MLDRFRKLAAFLALLSLMAVPAAAGPLEDGAAAYERGDYATALRLWRPLAEQGYAFAQYALGAMYAEGQGVPKDYVQAYMWWNLAAAQGHEDASKDRNIAAQSMTPAQIDEARALSRNWKPKK